MWYSLYWAGHCSDAKQETRNLSSSLLGMLGIPHQIKPQKKKLFFWHFANNFLSPFFAI